jgi:hypothetical protein
MAVGKTEARVMEGPPEIDGMGYVNQYGLSRKVSINTSVSLLCILWTCY